MAATEAPEILVVGQTGHGKSTFINRLANYFLGGSLTDLRVVIPTTHLPANLDFKHAERAVGQSFMSQTSACTTYHFVHRTTQQRFNFIDTPGLSDTAGLDDHNIALIVEAADRCSALTAIILVINGTVARQTTDIHNTLTRLRGIIPTALLENLLIVFTNCQEHTRNFNLDSLELFQQRGEFSSSKIFHLNNACFSKHPSSWTPMELRMLQEDWSDGDHVLDNLMKSIQTLVAVVFPPIQRNIEAVNRLLAGAVESIAALIRTREEIEETLSQSGMESILSISSAANRAIDAVRLAIATKAQLVAGQCQGHLRQNFPGVDVLGRLRSTVSQLQTQARGRLSIADRLSQDRTIHAYTEFLAALEQSSSSRSHSTEADLATAEQQVAQNFGSLRLQIQLERDNQAKAEEQRLRDEAQRAEAQRQESIKRHQRRAKNRVKEQQRNACWLSIFGCLVQVFALAFLACGLFVVAVTVWSMSKLRSLSVLASFSYDLPIGIVVVGSALAIIALGVCCAARRKTLLLTVCSLALLLCILLSQTGVTIALCYSEKPLFEAFQNDWVALGSSANGTQTKIDVETSFKCCGWSANTTVADREAVAMVAECASVPPNWTASCNSTIDRFITRHVDLIGFSSAGLLAVELLGLFVLICMSCCVHHKVSYEKEEERAALLSSSRPMTNYSV